VQACPPAAPKHAVAEPRPGRGSRWPLAARLLFPKPHPTRHQTDPALTVAAPLADRPLFLFLFLCHPSRTVVGPVDSPRADGEIPPRPRRTRPPGRSRRPPERRFAGRTRDRRRGRERALAVDVLGLIIGSSSTTPVRSSPTAASSPRAVSPSPPETHPDRSDQGRPAPAPDPRRGYGRTAKPSSSTRARSSQSRRTPTTAMAG
jgi:hypothetical protein